VELFQVAFDHAELCAEFTFVEVRFFLLSLLVFDDLKSPNANFGHLILAILIESLDHERHLVFFIGDFDDFFVCGIDIDALKVVDDPFLNKVWMLGGEELGLLGIQILIEIELSLGFLEFVFFTSHGLLVLVIYAIVGESFSCLGLLDHSKSLSHFSFGLLFRSSISLHPLVGHDFRHCRSVVLFQLEHALNEILERLGEEACCLISGMTLPENVGSVCSEAFVEWITWGSRVERWMLGDHDEQNDGGCEQVY
jgi:hypothetical protein